MEREDIDYNKVFAPVSKYISVKALLFLATAENMGVHQLDTKTAFLNRNLEEAIYMQQVQGYIKGGVSMVWYLHKFLYGLPQRLRVWHRNFEP